MKHGACSLDLPWWPWTAWTSKQSMNFVLHALASMFTLDNFLTYSTTETNAAMFSNLAKSRGIERFPSAIQRTCAHLSTLQPLIESKTRQNATTHHPDRMQLQLWGSRGSTRQMGPSRSRPSSLVTSAVANDSARQNKNFMPTGPTLHKLSSLLQ